jgi:hemolysin III
MTNMARENPIRKDAEELVNSITHGVGLVLSVAGFVVLLTLAIMHGSALRIVSCAIYGSTLICVYAASTLYHGITAPRFKHALKIVDHCAIYLLIAGTYTPFLLVNLGGHWGWSLLGVIWGLAMTGILLKFWFVDHFKIFSTAVYLAMGWLAVVAVKPLLLHISTWGIAWLVAGGLMYTIGVAFFAAPRLRYGHAIWHVFVMAGSICHYIAVLLVVVPAAKSL